MPKKENRNRQRPIPENFTDYLTAEQQAALNQARKFGWQLQFIRRPLFQEPTVVLSRFGGTVMAVVEKNGYVDMDHRTLALRA
jgi:hypothetical protein